MSSSRLIRTSRESRISNWWSREWGRELWRMPECGVPTKTTKPRDTKDGDRGEKALDSGRTSRV